MFYSRDSTFTVYTLHLKKKWIFSDGYKFFYFKNASLETDGVFEAMETFHPRLRKIVRSGLGYITDHLNIPANKFNVSLDSPYQGFVEEIEKMRRRKK